jgi:hypothetical protein
MGVGTTSGTDGLAISLVNIVSSCETKGFGWLARWHEGREGFRSWGNDTWHRWVGGSEDGVWRGSG